MFIADVGANIENDLRVTVKNLLWPMGHQRGQTIHLTLRHDLNLAKKSARWFPKLMTVKERGEEFSVMVAAADWQSSAIL